MEETLDSTATNAVTQKQPSSFTGGMWAYFGITLLSGLATLCSLGIAYPFMVCWKESWIASHTYVNGRKLRFDGNGMQLFGKYIIWLLLSIITFGIYYILCVAVRLEAWVTSHTHFDGTQSSNTEAENKSKFDGSWLGLLGVKLLTNFVTVITLSFGMYWAHCYKERWFAKHKIIDGCRLYFTGTGLQYFVKCIVWTLLTVITFGIYGFWRNIKAKKWTVEHTEAETLPECLDAIQPENGSQPENTDGNVTEAKEKKPKKPVNTFSIIGFVFALCILGFMLFITLSSPYVRYYDYDLFRIIYAMLALSDSYNNRIATPTITTLFLFAGLTFSILGLINARKNKENIIIPIIGVILNALPLLMLVLGTFSL